MHPTAMSGSMFLQFLNDSDETAFRRAQTAASYCMVYPLLVCGFITAITYAIVSADFQPLKVSIGSNIFLAALSTRLSKQSSTLQLVILWLWAAYINLRLSRGVLIFSADTAPPSVQSGYVLPDAITGTLACMATGRMVGLRFMRDILPPVLITLVTSVAHSVVVILPGGGTLHYPIATVAVTLLGCAAEYQNEFLERQRWMSLADLKRSQDSNNDEMADTHSWQHSSDFMESPSKTVSVKRSLFVLSLLVCMMSLAYSALQNSSDDQAPTAVRVNHPVPYAVHGVPIMVYSTQLMNLRPSKDCTTLTCLLSRVSHLTRLLSLRFLL